MLESMKRMMLIFVIFLLMTITCEKVLYAQEESADSTKVIEIDIKGNRNILKRTITDEIETKKGNDFSSKTLDSDIKKIYDLGFFSDIEVDVTNVEEGVRITFIVKEKPIIKSIDVKGNKKISRGTIKDKIRLKKDEAFDEFKIQQDKETIIAMFKDKGYMNAQVEVYTSLDENSRKIKVTFFITEGSKVTIEKIEVSGIKAFKKRTILAKMKKTRRKKVFKKEFFQEDMERIKTYYLNKGYAAVTLSEPEIVYNEDSTKVTIIFEISEGRQYSIGEITFSDNVIFTAEELSEGVEMEKGAVFNQKKLSKTMQNVAEMYSKKGYVYMNIIPQVDFVEKIMNINFVIQEGLLVYIDKIYIEGNTKTKEWVVMRELLVKEGDPFDGVRIRRSQEIIYNLGFFEDVQVETRATELENKLNLLINVKEQPTGMVSAGAGYSNVDKLLGTIRLSQTNLFGRGQRLSVMFENGARKKSSELDFTEPWLLGKPYSVGFGIFNRARATERTYSYTDISDSLEKEEIYDYREDNKGIELRLGRRLSDVLNVNFSYGYEQTGIFDTITKDTELRLKEEEGWKTTSSVTTWVVRDDRDNIFDATRGSRNTTSVKIAGGYIGGDNNFAKYNASSSWYFPTFWNMVLSLRLQVGIVERFSDSQDVPIYEKFFVGGADTVRGYAYSGEIGPLNGGKMMTVLNIEKKYNIPETPLQVAVFYDAGNAWEKVTGHSYKLKQGVGVGVRIKTPVFPIRLDYGIGLDHKPGEQKRRWEFAIGSIF